METIESSLLSKFREELACLEAYTRDDRETIYKAIAFILPIYENKSLAHGEPAIEHALKVMQILVSIRSDTQGIVSALLSLLPLYQANYEDELSKRFSGVIRGLVEGVQRMAYVQRLNAESARPAEASDKGQQLDAWRKMLLAMVDDIRVVVIKLAMHLQTLRFVVATNDQRIRQLAASEAMEIFAPLANRLGIWQFKWEMEDLALRIQDPVTYKTIALMLDEKRAARETYITQVIDTLKKQLHEAGIRAEVQGRPKHIYSIYKKMQQKNLSFEQLYDVRAVRVLVNDSKDCYAALGIVHNLWSPIAKEFDDYIAKPKSNQYRSLHTAVVGPEQKVLEVQIRSFEMHTQSEYGVAAHWRYKEGSKRDVAYEQKIAWLRQMMDWNNEVTNLHDLSDRFRTELLDDTIYVLTPQGKVIDLPKGATPLDFAYAVHTELGHRCRSAKVDGVMVPLDYQLTSGQRVEVMTSSEGGPSRDWLNAELGYLKSNRARAKVRQWFNNQDLQLTIAQGRAIAEKELQRSGMTALGLDKLAERFSYHKLEDFLAAVGKGEITARQLQITLRGPRQNLEDQQDYIKPLKSHAGGGEVLIVGVNKLLTSLARCCRPVPPDPIVGFITRGRGITVHRRECSNLSRLDSERLIAADWGAHQDAVFAVDIEVQAFDRQGLLRDISEALSRERINVIATRSVSRDQSATMFFTLEIKNQQQLQKLLSQLRELAGVEAARRL